MRPWVGGRTEQRLWLEPAPGTLQEHCVLFLLSRFEREVGADASEELQLQLELFTLVASYIKPPSIN